MKKTIFIIFNVLLIASLGAALAWKTLGNKGDDDNNPGPRVSGNPYKQIKSNFAALQRAKKGARDSQNKHRMELKKQAESLDKSLFYSAVRQGDAFFQVMMDDKDYRNRRDMLRIIGRIGTPEIFARLREQYGKCETEDIKLQMIEIVDSFKGDAALDFLESVIVGKDSSRLKRTALKVLARYRIPRSSTIICASILKETDVPTRGLAVRSLKDFHTPDVLTFLEKLIFNDKEDPDIRRISISSIGKSGGLKSKAVLARVLAESKDKKSKIAALKAIGSIGRQAGAGREILDMLKEYIDVESDPDLRKTASQKLSQVRSALFNPSVRPRRIKGRRPKRPVPPGR